MTARFESNKQFDAEASDLLSQIIQYRRDVRGNRFLPTPIEDSALKQILDAALHAPSVGFSQPWEFVLIKDKATKHKIRESFNTENDKAKDTLSHSLDKDKQTQYQGLKLEGIEESPLNLAVFYKPSKQPVLGQTSMPDMGRFSVVCAVQNMWLMARSLNIGMGWVSILNPDDVKAILKAPKDRELIAYLCVGYVDKFYDKPELELQKWEARKNAEQVIIKEQYLNDSFS
ncbi:Putative oxidoreductase NAD protein [Marinomonas sp. MED121]|uniref:5,6-dimethylbenzimidazole synthase n=1 Tax=Marinomonas sp. MED121 TaxID=314277 RepID=UPI0000690894|nr:5,6-dimethylbenzimidazole synthase [Marinomonas sp. MED121]EAQ64541.1 Putative oxidoreductase NAD protein [Marinomonas sp. MED121]